MRGSIAAVAAGLALATLLHAGQALAKPEVGKPAPDFRTTTFDGKVVTLKDLKGKVILINFWATWCGPCKTELPMLDAYYKVRKDAGYTALAVTTEDSIPVENLGRLARSMVMPMAYRFKGKPYLDYGDAVPVNFVIDRQGVVRYAEAGAFNLEALEKVMLPLLKEPVPAETAPAAVAAR
jgi:cytochrome c biogenesis protein CcmG/thiol:disulfide interchange protein DsbE